MQNVMITGAGRQQGLGYNMVLRYLEAGDNVIATARKESAALNELKKQYPDRLNILLMDISSNESVAEAAGQAAAILNHIDILINNAVTASPDNEKEFEDVNLDYIAQVVNVTSAGALRVIQAFLPLLLQGPDMTLVANITSEAGSIGKCYRTSWFDYSMSKCALNMGTKLLANKFAEDDRINFKCVHPGWIHTSEGSKDAPTEPYDGAETLRVLFERVRTDKHGPLFITNEGVEYPW